MRAFLGVLAWALSSITIRYVLVGGASFFVNFALFWLCHRQFGMWYVYATILAGTCAWVVNFPLHKFWTFEDYRRESTRVQAPAHFTLKLLNTYVSDPFLLFLLVEKFNVSPLWGKVVVGAVLGLQNYLLCRYLIFNRSA